MESNLKKLAQDDATRVTLLSLEKAELDQKNLLYQARKEGRKEGIQEGEKKGLQKGLQEGEKKGLQKGLQEGEKKGLQKGLQEGEKKGLQKGLQEGEFKKSIQVAKAMFKQGLDIPMISTITELPIEKVKEILEQ